MKSKRITECRLSRMESERKMEILLVDYKQAEVLIARLNWLWKKIYRHNPNLSRWHLISDDFTTITGHGIAVVGPRPAMLELISIAKYLEDKLRIEVNDLYAGVVVELPKFVEFLDEAFPCSECGGFNK